MNASKDKLTDVSDPTASVGEPAEQAVGVGSEDEQTAPDMEPSELPLDQVFEILKNKRRREALAYLRSADELPVTIGELAEHIAAIENDTTPDAISSSERKRVYVGLYQCHLPKMDEYDVVDFDKDRGNIQPDENISELERFVDAGEAEVDSRRWDRHAPLLSAAVATLLILARVAFPGVVSAELVLGLFVVAVVALTGLGALSSRVGRLASR